MRLTSDPNASIHRIDFGGKEFDALLFSCPKCNDGECMVLVPFERSDDPKFKPRKTPDGKFVWRAYGQFPHKFSLHPSVDVKESKGGPSHWHGWVIDGEAK